MILQMNQMMQIQSKTFKDIVQMQTQVPNTMYVNPPIIEKREYKLEKQKPKPKKKKSTKI